MVDHYQIQFALVVQNLQTTLGEIVGPIAVLFFSITSGHFEWASTATKYIFPFNGPAKSM